MHATYLIYGASGYMGELIARAARARGHTPILAGRNPQSVHALAVELGLEARVFDLEDGPALERGLTNVGVVLHCAGPFKYTWRPMLEACLRQRVHYLDITGDVFVLEALSALTKKARDAQIMLVPGVGFDVVPTDGLAVHLKRCLPSATSLELGFHGVEQHSRGSTLGTIERLGKPSLVRRAGQLVEIAMARNTRLIDFGRGPQTAIAIPWGDLCTAFHSTGIPNIDVFMGISNAARHALRVAYALKPVVQAAPVQALLKRGVALKSAGPDASARGRVSLWGSVRDPHGGHYEARAEIPDPYTLTALTALAAVERVLNGEIRLGFQTPSRVFGAEFAWAIPGVNLVDRNRTGGKGAAETLGSAASAGGRIHR